MPFKILKNKGKRDSFRVIKVSDKSVKAKDTTLRKAKAQVRLLNYIDGMKNKHRK